MDLMASFEFKLIPNQLFVTGRNLQPSASSIGHRGWIRVFDWAGKFNLFYLLYIKEFEHFC